MQYGILGPLEVVDGARRLELGPHRQRALLAIFLLHVDEVVSLDRLIDQLWGDTPPNTATGSLQAYVSNLRRVLEPDRGPRQPAQVLVTEAPGYRLRVDPDAVDAVRFERLTVEGRAALAAGEIGRAVATFDEALSLWRGEALAEFHFESFVDTSITRLGELRATAEEDRVVGWLAAGDHTGAVLALDRLVDEYPLRERLRGLQMLALYRSGRQAEALRAYDAARRLLAEELGLQPGPELQALFQQVLDHDPALDGAAPAPRGRPTIPAVVPAIPDVVPAAPQSASGGSFVGRAEVLETLTAALDEAMLGQPRFVLVGGEPGIGKSRLAEELSALAEARGALVTWGRCHDDDGMPPLWPWVQVIGAMQHNRGKEAASLAELLGVDDEAVDPAGTDFARFRLYECVRLAIEQRAAISAVMIVLDDMQWADASSLRLLRYLAVELRPAPILVVGTFHEPDATSGGALATALADLVRRPSVERHTMIGLTQSDVADLVRLDTTVTGDDVDSVATELHKRTDGNPFFVTELVRLLTSERTLEVADRTNDIPLVVSDVIRRRLRRLPDNVHGVLGVAAVIGREFDLDVLHVAAGLAVDDAFEVLEAAVMARVVIETQPGLYRFSHGLVRETLFSDLTPGRRARLHAKVGEAIEAIYADDLGRHVSQLARHFAAADRWVAAVRYSELAAEQAESSFAYDEAVAHWRVAIEHAADDAHADIARLLIRLGAAHRGAGDAVTSADMHDLALEAAEASGDLALLAEAALAYGEVGLWQVRPYGTVDQRVVAAISTVLESQGIEDSPVRARLLAGLAIALYYQESERERGRQLVREAAALARRIGDRDLLGAILAELLVMLEGQPDTSEQLTIAGELDMVVGPDTPFETVATASMRLARIRLAAGDAQDLEREIAELSVRAAEQRHAVIMLWVMWARTGVAFVRGRLDEAERLAGEARERHEQLGIWGASETYATHMTYVWREQDRMEEVGPVVEPLLEEAAHPGSHKLLALYRLERGAKSEIAALIDRHLIPASHDFTWLPEMCLTAELCAGGDVDGAADLYAELLPFGGLVATMDGPYICMGAVSYYLGLLADTMSRHDDAIAHLEHAVALNDQVGAVPWSARSRYHLARVLGGDDPDRVDRLVTEGLDIADTHNLPAIRRQFRGLHAVH